MSMQQEITTLKERLAQLERRTDRGRTNHTGAARYLGITTETLRQRYLQGDGPRRTRVGSRNWSYSFDDLDAYIEGRVTSATPAREAV